MFLFVLLFFIVIENKLPTNHLRQIGNTLPTQFVNQSRQQKLATFSFQLRCKPVSSFAVTEYK